MRVDHMSDWHNEYHEHCGVTVGGAKVTAADSEASNGIIHVIDKVLLPQE